jgi:hypothetical protein
MPTIKYWLSYRAFNKSAAARCRARMLDEQDPQFRRCECACMMIYLRSIMRANMELRSAAAKGLCS